jgi:8-oxo-dGTP pyrophosphatase MutT (NUDIX family)
MTQRRIVMGDHSDAKKRDFMVAAERFIDRNGPALKASGFVTRNLAHFHGVPHTTVLVVPICLLKPEPKILVHRRPAGKKVSPNTWDTFGGHVEVAIQDGKVLPPGDKIWSEAVFHQLIDDTAIREANEEMEFKDFKFTSSDIRRFGGYGDFEWGTQDVNAQNVEYSSVFVAEFPEAAGLPSVCDTIGKHGKEVKVINLEIRCVTLDCLLMEYAETPSAFADGLGRILQRLTESPGTRRSFEALLLPDGGS